MYTRLSGRYPFAIEKALEQYGDIVRVAPNELVVFTPKAFTGWITHSLVWMCQSLIIFQTFIRLNIAALRSSEKRISRTVVPTSAGSSGRKTRCVIVKWHGSSHLPLAHARCERWSP